MATDETTKGKSLYCLGLDMGFLEDIEDKNYKRKNCQGHRGIAQW